MQFNIDLLILNETWLSDLIPDNFINDNYIMFRKDRDKRGGGVLIAVKKCYKCVVKSFDNKFEEIWVEIFINRKKFLFGTLYRPPNFTIDFKSYFNDRFESIDSNFYDLICFLGDLNINFIKYGNRLSKEALHIRDVMHLHGMHQLIETPTYSVVNPKSILDLFFTNKKDFIVD